MKSYSEILVRYVGTSCWTIGSSHYILCGTWAVTTVHVFKQNLTFRNLKGVYYLSACRTEQPLAADGELLTGIYNKYSNGRFKQTNKQNCF